MLPPSPCDGAARSYWKAWIEGEAVGYSLGVSKSDRARRPSAGALALVRAEIEEFGVSHVRAVVSSGGHHWSEQEAEQWFSALIGEGEARHLPVRREGWDLPRLEESLSSVSGEDRSEFLALFERAGLSADQVGGNLGWEDICKYALARARWDDGYMTRLSAALGEREATAEAETQARSAVTSLIGRLPTPRWRGDIWPTMPVRYEWQTDAPAQRALEGVYRTLSEWGFSGGEGELNSHPFGNLNPRAKLTIEDVCARLTFLHFVAGEPLHHALKDVLAEARWARVVQSGLDRELARDFNRLFVEGPLRSIADLASAAREGGTFPSATATACQ
ncbi:hypothetical protein [Amorphus sp. 3PC139-8]|uniref:hypothetical protein n=1 Tax=Amorphus sp. 3PC139-8 TaxID=2735676 RepID=UPI00345CF653